MTLDQAAVESAPSPPRRRGRIVLLAVALTLGLLAWEWRHPDDPFRAGYGIALERPAGAAVWTSLLDPGWAGPESLTITDLEADIVDDGARVEVEYRVCELDAKTLSDEPAVAFGFGGDDAALDRYCLRTYPAVGATLDRDASPAQQLVVGVASTEPGRTHIEGFDVAYRTGWQVGTSTVDVEVEVLAG